MHEQLHGSILIISHQERILNIADQIILIADGKLVKKEQRKRFCRSFWERQMQRHPVTRLQIVNKGESEKMDAIQRELLMQVAGLHEIPAGAYNIRSNGQSIERKSTGNIEIINKPDKSGIEIHIKPGTKKESVHIPVIMSQSGLEEVVYNDFYIGEMQTLRSLPLRNP